MDRGLGRATRTYLTDRRALGRTRPAGNCQSVFLASWRERRVNEGGVDVLIDCETCTVREVACADCVVTALLGNPGSSVDLDEVEHVAVGVLAQHGLVPPLRLVSEGAITHRNIA
jgi:hypothetical protein